MGGKRCLACLQQYIGKTPPASGFCCSLTTGVATGVAAVGGRGAGPGGEDSLPGITPVYDGISEVDNGFHCRATDGLLASASSPTGLGPNTSAVWAPNERCFRQASGEKHLASAQHKVQRVQESPDKSVPAQLSHGRRSFRLRAAVALTEQDFLGSGPEPDIDVLICIAGPLLLCCTMPLIMQKLLAGASSAVSTHSCTLKVAHASLVCLCIAP